MNFAGIYKAGDDIRFVFHFATNSEGVTGLAPDFAVFGPGGAILPSVAVTVSELDDTNHPGVYVATLDGDDTTLAGAGNYIATSTVAAGADNLESVSLAVVMPELTTVNEIDTAVGQIDDAVTEWQGSFGYSDQLKRVGAHQQVTVSNTVTTIDIPKRATGVLISGSQDARYTLDGTDPTASKGFRLSASATEPTFIQLYPNTSVLKMIREDASDSVVDYQFFKPA